MSGGLYGKAALITNATDAVGLAISRRLGLAGAKVFLTDSNKEQLEKVVSELSDVGVVASGAVVDLAQASQHQPLFTEVRNKLKRLDCLVLNPGQNHVKGDIIENSRTDFDEVFSQFVSTPFHTTVSALPLLEESKNGSVVLISSIAGFAPFLDVGLFSTAQTALLGLTKALAKDLGPRRVRVNSVALGMFADDGSGAVWNSEEGAAQLRQVIPLGRVARACDCAALVEFLASDRAKYVTGENCPLTGGVNVRL